MNKQDNKDYILNIRISKDTFSKVKSKAKENKESVSALVRKIIDDSYEVMGDLKKDIFNDANSAEDLECFSQVVMAKNTKCAKCGKGIKKGAVAIKAEDEEGKKHFYCQSCKK